MGRDAGTLKRTVLLHANQNLWVPVLIIAGLHLLLSSIVTFAFD